MWSVFKTRWMLEEFVETACPSFSTNLMSLQNYNKWNANNITYWEVWFSYANKQSLGLNWYQIFLYDFKFGSGLTEENFFVFLAELENKLHIFQRFCPIHLLQQGKKSHSTQFRFHPLLFLAGSSVKIKTKVGKGKRSSVTV